MSHQKSIRRFGRTREQRVALMRSLTRALVKNEKIMTTQAKAKSLRPYMERLITMAEKDNLATRRLLLRRLGNDKETTSKLIQKIAPRYKDRAGGYTRITKIFTNTHESRPQAVIEFV